MYEPISDTSHINAERIGAILHKRGILNGAVVKKVYATPNKYTGRSVNSCLQIEYAGSKPPLAPTRLFLKMSNEGNGGAEPYFYNTLSPSVPNLAIPTCYDAQYYAETNQYHLLLQDVSQTHVSPQVGPNFIWPQARDHHHVGLLIDGFARLHALSWGDWQWRGCKSTTARLDISLVPDTVLCIESTALNTAEYATMTEERLMRFFDSVEGGISLQWRAHFKKAAKEFPRLMHRRIDGGKHLSFTHSDTFSHNLLMPITLDADEVYIIDWQNLRLWYGLSDLASHIGRFWTADIRQELEREMIKRYYKRLVEYGVHNYSWEECWNDYRLGILAQFYTRVRVPGEGGWDWNPWWRWVFDNVICAFEDLHCSELLNDS